MYGRDSGKVFWRAVEPSVTGSVPGTVASLASASRKGLTDAQCRRAIETMRLYFAPGKPVYAWFEHLDRVARGIGKKYSAGEGVILNGD